MPALAQSADPIKGVIAPNAKVELVQEGYKFTEGPVGTAKGELYFTDNRADQILLLDSKGKISLAYDKTDNANGLAFSRSGELFEVQGVGKKVNKRGKDGKVTTLADGIGGKPFLAPNDLILDAKGGIYFTDPGPRPVVAGRKAYVYYLPPGAKEPVVVDDTLVRPNGLTLAFGGRMLIVDDSVSNEVSAWDVQRDGTVKNKRALIKLHDIPEGKESGADGMAIDMHGPALHRDHRRRAGVRRQGPVSRHHQGAAPAEQRRLRRKEEGRALHHGPRRALQDRDVDERPGAARQVATALLVCADRPASCGRRPASRSRRRESG